MKNDTIIFSEFLGKFIANLTEKGKSSYTIVAYKKDIEQFLGHLAKKAVAQITDVKKDDISEFINSLLSSNYTKKSASRKLNSIRTFYRFLKEEGIVTINPALDVAHPRFETNKPRVLSKIEYRALRDYARRNKRTYAIIELFLQTGLRIGELAMLKTADVDGEELVIRATAGNKERRVQLNKIAKRSVEDYLKTRESSTSEHLFITKNEKPLLIRNIRNIVDNCFREVGIENAKVNDLRNTFIAHQLAAGVPLAYVSKIVGHKRLSSTEQFLDLVAHETPPSQYKLDEL